MGKSDTITKEYMKDSRRFADVFNYLVYDGEQVIRAEDLQEKDSTELIVFLDDDTDIQFDQKYRDILKQCVIMKDDKAYYVLLGIENQSSIHYAMPVKNALYDALNYASQVKETGKINKENGGLTREEFLSGFKSDDKLLPVITLTILWNEKTWDAPKSLHEMMAVQDERILKFVPDYRLNLITPNGIEDFSKFCTELGEAFAAIKAASDYRAMKKLLTEQKNYFSDMDWETAKLISICANIPVSIPEEETEGGFDMYQAFREAALIGKEEGKAEGKAEGKVEGKAEEKKDIAIRTYRELPTLSLETIATIVDASVDVVKQWILGAGMQLR